MSLECGESGWTSGDSNAKSSTLTVGGSGEDVMVDTVVPQMKGLLCSCTESMSKHAWTGLVLVKDGAIVDSIPNAASLVGIIIS